MILLFIIYDMMVLCEILQWGFQRELSDVVELRRRFPLITDNARARKADGKGTAGYAMHPSSDAKRAIPNGQNAWLRGHWAFIEGRQQLDFEDAIESAT